jgi:hypothetical protein
MDTISEVTGVNRSRIESLYNCVRGSGEIPKGGRGVYALRVTAEHVAKFLIAVCCADQVKDAADVIRRYSNLCSVDSHLLLRDLIALLDAPLSNEVFVTFIGPPSWAEVTIEIDGSSTDYLPVGDVQQVALVDPTKQRQRRRVTSAGGDIRTTVEISDRTLRALGALLRA